MGASLPPIADIRCPDGATCGYDAGKKVNGRKRHRIRPAVLDQAMLLLYDERLVTA
ncbi:hypothetical protein [Streptomyces marianii]|uniref:hypothetical protein n=1 Tax=Streptomyces marianii TaxID=1817406 RepID=UPI0014860197|nr:hypothetical protein [Streptomyces marianii]